MLSGRALVYHMWGQMLNSQYQGEIVDFVSLLKKYLYFYVMAFR